jgi:hypothetical protein
MARFKFNIGQRVELIPGFMKSCDDVFVGTVTARGAGWLTEDNIYIIKWMRDEPDELGFEGWLEKFLRRHVEMMAL